VGDWMLDEPEDDWGDDEALLDEEGDEKDPDEGADDPRIDHPECYNRNFPED
jgi:hypothetical protein